MEVRMGTRYTDYDQLLRDERFDELRRRGLLESSTRRRTALVERASSRLKTLVQPARRAEPGALTIRHAGPEDERAVARLAELDDREPPSGPLLLAEVEQEILVVLPFDGTAPVADPLRPTAGLVDLLRLRRRQLERREQTAA
jgi:hypothetical protein